MSAKNEDTGRFCRCEVCGGKRYLVSTRDDGRQAVEACDNCRDETKFFDEDAAVLAQRDGISCEATYPCYLTGDDR